MRRQPQQPRALATRQTIIDGGFCCVSQFGFAPTTTRHIAKASGMSIGTLYEYFTNKEEVFAAMQRHLVDEVIAMIERLTPEITRLEVDAGLELLFKAFTTLLMQEDQRYLVVAQQMLQSDVSHYMDELNQVLMALVVQYVMEQPRLARISDLTTMAYIFINGGIYVLLRNLSTPHPAVSLPQLITSLARLISQYVEHDLQRA